MQDLKEAYESLTLRDLFEAFEEVSAFCLKVGYMYKGRLLKADYVPSLSCFMI